MGNAFLTVGLWTITGMLVSIPVLMILKACIVDGTLDAGPAFMAILVILTLVGGVWSNTQSTGMMLLCVVLLLGGCVAAPLLGLRGGKRAMQAMDDEDISKYRRAIEMDPNNAGAHVFLGDALMKRGSYVAAVAQYEAAISINPRSDHPHAESWNYKLRKAREAGAGIEVATRLIVCTCGAESPVSAKTCGRCGATLQMSFFKWLTQPGNMKDIVRVAVPAFCMVAAALAIFSSLPLEWKGCILMASAIVGGYFLLRAIGD